MANTSRMTSYQRREQLIEIGRSLFASKGFEAVSVEEIAATAKVSKPIVYEHFGGKEGLYAVVVDREMRALTDTLVNALSDPQAHPRQIVERTALALLTYVEENAEGFRVLTRDSPKTDPASSFNSLLGDIALRVEDILAEAFKRQHLPAKGVPYYAQMLIGMTVYTCQYWADQRKLSKEQIAAHIVNLAWHGLSRMEAKPELRFESDKATKEAEKQERREIKEIAKRERKAAKEAQSQNNTESPAEQNAEQNTEQDAAGSQARKPNSSRKTQPPPVIASIAANANRRQTQESNSTSNRGIASIAQANKHRRKLTNCQQRYLREISGADCAIQGAYCVQTVPLKRTRCYVSFVTQ